MATSTGPGGTVLGSNANGTPNTGLTYNPQAAQANMANPLAGFSSGPYGGIPVPPEQYALLNLPPERSYNPPALNLPSFSLNLPSLPQLDLNLPELNLNLDSGLPALDLNLPNLNLALGSGLPNLDLALPEVNLNLGSNVAGLNLNLPELNLNLDADLPALNLNLPTVDLNLASNLPDLNFNLPNIDLSKLSAEQWQQLNTNLGNLSYNNLNLGNSGTTSNTGSVGSDPVKLNPGGYSATRKQYEPIAREMAKKYNLPSVNAFLNQITQESQWQPWASSGAGAVGIAQFTSATAKDYKLKDRTDPVASLDAAARKMRDDINKFGSLKVALAAYNAGVGSVDDFKNGTNLTGGNKSLQKTPDGIPPWKETQNYIATIMGNANV